MITERDNKVLKYLASLYGSEPQPLRSYLTQQEANNLTKSHAAGRAVFADMNITGYGCRHRAAVEESVRIGLDPGCWDFWQKARLTFLELGGDYACGQEPPIRAGG